MQTQEIVLAITRPETEWIGGRAVQKMSPTFDHSRVQTVLAARLEAWCGERGRVGTEWRFRVAPAGEARRPLVPDISFVRIERLRGHARADIQAPAFAPDVAFEVRSPGDRAADIAEKIDVFLRSGCALVVEIDPVDRSIMLHEHGSTMVLEGEATLRHDALPDFELHLATFFRDALDF